MMPIDKGIRIAIIQAGIPEDERYVESPSQHGGF